MTLTKKLNMICVTFQRPGFHCYPDAPDAVSYLRSAHRHLFKFKVCVEVLGNNRELEFHMFLNWLQDQFDETLQLDHKSCEMLSDDMAEVINARFPGRRIIIEVWEDGECGSLAEYAPGTETETALVHHTLAVRDQTNLQEKGKDCPLPLSVIPNYMGINLCSVRSVDWVVQGRDNQLVSLTINFVPVAD